MGDALWHIVWDLLRICFLFMCVSVALADDRQVSRLGRTLATVLALLTTVSFA